MPTPTPTDLPPPPDDLNALPAGTRFGELELLRLLGTGGFGIVYLAQDHALERLVAVKEYMPGQLAQRQGGSQVSVRSGSLRETFDLGLRSFVNEARLLARFDHRSLLKVYRFWEANNTAYMVMPYLQGQTLKQWRDAHGAPDATWLTRMLLPLLEALGQLHSANVYHRDIAPDNIYLPADGGQPILLDFGAARRAIGDHTQSFTAILKPSYAPLEQYDGASSLKQGPWTDLYALGAVIHYLITGGTPPAATRRALSDEYHPLAAQDYPAYPQALLAAVDWALALRPNDRPQSVAAFQEALLGRHDAPLLPLPPAAPSASAMEPTQIMAGQNHLPTQILSGKNYEATQLMTAPHKLANTAIDVAVGPAAAAPAVEPTIPVAAPLASPPQVALTPRPAPASHTSAAPQSARKPPWVLIGLVLAGLLLVAFWSLLGGGGQPAAALPGLEAASAAASTVVTADPASASASSTYNVPALAAGESFVEPLKPGAVPPPRVAGASAPSQRPSRAELRANAQAAVSPASTPQRASAVSTDAAQGSKPHAASAAHPLVETDPAGRADPRAACGSRQFIALTLCIDRKCGEAAHAQHPECVRLREIREQRDRDRSN